MSSTLLFHNFNQLRNSHPALRMKFQQRQVSHMNSSGSFVAPQPPDHTSTHFTLLSLLTSLLLSPPVVSSHSLRTRACPLLFPPSRPVVSTSSAPVNGMTHTGDTMGRPGGKHFRMGEGSEPSVCCSIKTSSSEYKPYDCVVVLQEMETLILSVVWGF